jgi:hypothetical protein
MNSSDPNAIGSKSISTYNDLLQDDDNHINKTSQKKRQIELK